MAKSKRSNSKYQQKLKVRRSWARDIGSKAFFKNKDGKEMPFPMPLMCEV